MREMIVLKYRANLLPYNLTQFQMSFHNIDYELVVAPNDFDKLIAQVQNSHKNENLSLYAPESSMEQESIAQPIPWFKPFEDPVYIKAPEPKTSLLVKREHKYVHPNNSPKYSSAASKTAFKVNAGGLSAAIKSQNDADESFSPSESQQEGKRKRGNEKTPRKRGNGGKTKKLKKGKKDQYPTKNFLPKFRSPFLNYLSKYFDEQYFEDIPIVKRIRGKPCINLQDYQDLFNHEEFRPYLEVYFRNKMIVRDLMQSRMDYQTKREYFKRIHVFEKAFKTRKFEKINE